jgi:hypothetical protein
MQRSGEPQVKRGREGLVVRGTVARRTVQKEDDVVGSF